MSPDNKAQSEGPILLVGFSTRGIAESAVRGGYNVITLDYFGDRDQKELVQNYSLMRDFDLGFSAEALLIASRSLSFVALAYVSSLENHPDVLEEMAGCRTLLGNYPATLRRARDWGTLREVCLYEGIPFPATLLPGEEPQADRRKVWLTKPLRSGGGHGIVFWRGDPLGERRFLQEYIKGTPASAAFVADGQDCVLIGITEQLIGRRELGAHRFTWCGNILLPPRYFLDKGGAGVIAAVREIIRKITRVFGLRGVNGVDLVLSRDETGCLVPYLVEVNPRYTASMELMEQAYGINIFDLHVRACRGELPSFSLEESADRTDFYGKGIVYARKDVVMPETVGWKSLGRRDIPFPGEPIAARHPICTVLAQGNTRDQCWHRLRTAAEAVWREVEQTPSEGGESNA